MNRIQPYFKEGLEIAYLACFRGSKRKLEKQDDNQNFAIHFCYKLKFSYSYNFAN